MVDAVLIRRLSCWAATKLSYKFYPSPIGGGFRGVAKGIRNGLQLRSRWFDSSLRVHRGMYGLRVGLSIPTSRVRLPYAPPLITYEYPSRAFALNSNARFFRFTIKRQRHTLVYRYCTSVLIKTLYQEYYHARQS